MMSALPSDSPQGGAISRTQPAPSKTGLAVLNATPADHVAIVRFLSSEYPGWSPDRLKASFDHPHYEPPDRLLIKIGSRPIAHAHVTRHSMQYGAIRLPVGELQCLVVSPEFRRGGLGRKVLEASQRQMTSHGSLIALARATEVSFFERLGWAAIGCDCRSTIATESLLSEMHAQELIPKSRRGRLNVRLARRLEMETIARIHHCNLPGTFGPMERTGAIWRWMVDGRVCEQLYVATTGPSVLEIEDDRSEIVAYAAVQGGRILELLTSPGRRAAAVPLLVRLCREGIERNHRNMAFFAPATDRLHALFRLAGGRTEDRRPHGGQVLMARVLSPAKLLRQMGPELFRRAEAAGLKLPWRWSLAIDRRAYLVALDARGATVTSGGKADDELRLAACDLAPLVLGRLDWAAALADGRLKVKGPWMDRAGAVLFPTLPSWYPPLDSLAASAGHGRDS